MYGRKRVEPEEGKTMGEDTRVYTSPGEFPEPRDHGHNQVAGFRVDDRPRAMPIVPPPLFCHFHLLHPVILPVRYPVHPSGAGGMARSRPEYTRRMDERVHTQLNTLHGPYTSIHSSSRTIQDWKDPV